MEITKMQIRNFGSSMIMNYAHFTTKFGPNCTKLLKFAVPLPKTQKNEKSKYVALRKYTYCTIPLLGTPNLSLHHLEFPTLFRLFAKNEISPSSSTTDA